MRYFQFIFVAFILMFPPLANAEVSQGELTIHTYQADVNGDGLVEEIILKGIPFSEEGDYFHYIWAEIKGDAKESKINYGDGYEPNIQFFDLNQDNVQDILYESTKQENSGVYHQKLHTLSKNNLEEITLPDLRYVSGNFIDDFKINLTFSPYKKPKQIDVKERSNLYIEAGLYKENGTLNRQKYLSMNNVSYYQPVKLNSQKGYGLRSYKQVHGISHQDHLGTIETLWYYDDGKWVVIQSDWKEL